MGTFMDYYRGKMVPEMPGFTDPAPDQDRSSGPWFGGGLGIPESQKPPFSPELFPQRRALKGTAADQKEREAVVGGRGTALPLVYGRVKLGAVIAFAGVKNDTLHLVCVWGEGEIQEVETLYLDGKEVGEYSGVSAQHFTGAASQTCPSALSSAFPGYEDDLPYIAYTYLRVPASADLSGFPRVTAVIKGLKVYDPRTAQTAYSNNPALCLADFLTSDRYGLDREVDWDSVGEAADACDQVVNGKPRRALGLALQAARPARQWLETLRAYAGCFIYQDGGKNYLVPDRPRAADHSFDTDNILRHSLSLSYKREADLPTVVEVAWTDPDDDWRDKVHREEQAGAPQRVARYYLPGITDPSQARREAVERLNRSVLCPLALTFTTVDYGLAVTPGDVIQVTHDIGLDNKLFRVLWARNVSSGSWQIQALEYDEGVYSDAVASSSTSDTTLADPNHPPAPTGLALTEIVYQKQPGFWASRIRASWDDMKASFPFVESYRVSMEGEGLVYEGTSLVTEAVSPAVQEGRTYTVTVRTVSTTGAVSGPATAQVTAQGKQLPPGNVPSIKEALEVGGWVLLRWEPAPDLDIEGYEIRRGAVTDDWDSAPYTLAVKHQSTVFFDKNVPQGAHRYLVKAIDSVGQYSPDAAYADVEVSADASFLFVGEHQWRAADFTLTNFSKYLVEGQGWYFIPDNGEPCKQGYTQQDDSIGTFADDGLADVPMCLPRSGYGSGFVMESNSWDLGAAVGGQWSAGGMAVTEYENGDNAGQAPGIRLSANDTDWDDYDSFNTLGNGRYARIKIADDSDGPDATFTIRLLPAHMSCHAKEREERGAVSVPAGASQPATVTLEGSYAAVKDLQLTAEGAGGAVRIPVYDNLTVTGFEVYLFDDAGSKVSGTVRYRFVGV